MFFVQLKSIDKPAVEKITVRPRYNVEKRPLTQDPAQEMEIEVIKFQIDVSELLTIQSMGAAIPVLLILVALDSETAYFVCLNDLIEKVILPGDPTFHLKNTKTILIPIKNVITNQDVNLLPLRFYAKRAKFYAAFSKFSYQRKELDFSRDLSTVDHFIKIISRYDFWNRTPEWPVVAEMRGQIEDVQRMFRLRESTGELKLSDHIRVVGSKLLGGEFGEEGFETREFIWSTCILMVWDRLVNMNSMYEELCREWFLPTYLSKLMSYPDEAKNE